MVHKMKHKNKTINQNLRAPQIGMSFW